MPLRLRFTSQRSGNASSSRTASAGRNARMSAASARNPAASASRSWSGSGGGELIGCRPMRMKGLEPSRPYGHTDLNRARLPIPPHPRAGRSLSGGTGSGEQARDLFGAVAGLRQHLGGVLAEPRRVPACAGSLAVDSHRRAHQLERSRGGVLDGLDHMRGGPVEDLRAASAPGRRGRPRDRATRPTPRPAGWRSWPVARRPAPRARSPGRGWSESGGRRPDRRGRPRGRSGRTARRFRSPG